MERLQSLLKNPEKVHSDDLQDLSVLIERYPYFQAARSLYLKCLKDNNSPLYNIELQKTAAHTTDRSVLFDFITSPVFVQNETGESIKDFQELYKEIEVEEVELKIRANNLNADAHFDHVSDPNLFEKKNKITEEPLDFRQDEVHSFNEWLKLTNLEPLEQNQDAENDIDGPKASSSLLNQKMERIDKFLANKPKIKPSKEKIALKDLNIDTAPRTSLMTETLAKVYLAQKNYEKAIKSYEILVLQHPEKSGFFADQIQEIKNLQSNT